MWSHCITFTRYTAGDKSWAFFLFFSLYFFRPRNFRSFGDSDKLSNYTLLIILPAGHSLGVTRFWLVGISSKESHSDVEGTLIILLVYFCVTTMFISKINNPWRVFFNLALYLSESFAPSRPTVVVRGRFSVKFESVFSRTNQQAV